MAETALALAEKHHGVLALHHLLQSLHGPAVRRTTNGCIWLLQAARRTGVLALVELIRTNHMPQAYVHVCVEANCTRDLCYSKHTHANIQGALALKQLDKQTMPQAHTYVCYLYTQKYKRMYKSLLTASTQFASTRHQ